jgi:hypothetical protein
MSAKPNPVHDFGSTSETSEEDTKGQDENFLVEREDNILEEDGPSGTVIRENGANLSPFDGGGTIREDNSWLIGSPNVKKESARSSLL